MHVGNPWKGASRQQSLRQFFTYLLCAYCLVSTVAADGLKQQYCSDQNTADTPSSQSLYQSLGLCQTTCASKFALAIVQGQSCWCSNYLPADTTSVRSCSAHCPGYPYENCGSEEQDYYGYMVLNEEGILGTAGPNSATKSKTSPIVSSSADPQSNSDDYATSSISSSALSISSAQSSKSSSRSSATWTPTPVTTVLTRTVSNRPVTQTVTSAPSLLSNGESSGSALPKKNNKSGVSAGLIAGVVIATIVGIFLIAGAIYLIWRRKRQEQVEAGVATGTTSPGSNRPNRNTSVLSKTGLLDKVYPAAAVRGHPSNQNLNGSGGLRPDMAERRNSRPLYYDQRLNPAALMDIDNASRVSVNTIPDNRDFSRPLNVTNPDV